MVENGFDSHELDQLTRDLYKIAQQDYPKQAKAMLKKQGNIGRGKLLDNTKAVTKKKTGNLLKGIKRSNVHQYKGDFQIRVKNTAPHAHLIEYGHSMVAWGNNTELFVPGKYPARKTADEMLSGFPQAVEEFVDEMLEEGLYL